MAQSLICCPLCSLGSFSSNNNLCLALINAASKWLRCTLCEEEVRGLDKLTVHLLGHLMYTEEFKKLLDIESKNKTNKLCINKCPEPLNLVKSNIEAEQNINEIAANYEPANVSPPCDLLGSLQLERCSIKIDDEVMIVFNHSSSNYQDNNKQIEMFRSTENTGTEIGLPKFTISFKNDGSTIENSQPGIDHTRLHSTTVVSSHSSQVSTSCTTLSDNSSSNYLRTDTSTDLPANNHQEEMELSSLGNSFQDSKSNNTLTSTVANESNVFSDLERLTCNKSSYLSPSGERVLGYRCDVCSLVFPDEQILNMHRQLIHIELSGDAKIAKSYRCHLCSKSFVMKGSLMVHMRVAHFGGAVVARLVEAKQLEADAVSPDSAHFVCSICNKGFRKEQQLAQHEKFHDGKQCDVCHKTFTTRYFLRKHKRLHTGEMPYTCGVCNKSFTFQQSYHKHLLYHSDDKPYPCGECGRAFKELSTLHNHQRIHTGEKPFSCDTCGKCFRQRVSYLVHRRIHTGVMPYSCQICGKTFRYKVSERTHKCNVSSSVESTETTPSITDKYQDAIHLDDCSDLKDFLEKENTNIDAWSQKRAMGLDNVMMEDNRCSEPTDFFALVMSPSDKMQQLSLSSADDKVTHAQMENTDHIDTESLKQLLDEVADFT